MQPRIPCLITRDYFTISLFSIIIKKRFYRKLTCCHNLHLRIGAPAGSGPIRGFPRASGLTTKRRPGWLHLGAFTPFASAVCHGRFGVSVKLQRISEAKMENQPDFTPPRGELWLRLIISLFGLMMMVFAVWYRGLPEGPAIIEVVGLAGVFFGGSVIWTARKLWRTRK